jgi:PAS domain S-box-containing protein
MQLPAAAPSAGAGAVERRATQGAADVHHLLVEHSLGLICTHDLAGTLLLVNRAAAEALGYSPEDGVGRNLRDFLVPDARPLFDAYLDRMREHGQDSGLLRVLSRDGAERIWMYRNIRRDEPGREPCVLGHAIDVTERIAAERALRESEQALIRAYDEMETKVRERTAELQQANERLRAEMLERQRAEETRERALVRERDTLAFLGEVSLQLTPVIDFEGVLSALKRVPVPFLAEWTLVFVVTHDAVRCVGGAHVMPEGRRALAALELAATTAPPAGCLLARAVSTGRPQVDAGHPADIAAGLLGSGPAPLLEALAPRALLAVPVRSGDVVAVACLGSLNDARFTASDILIADDFAARVNAALDRVALYHDAQEANRLKDEFLSTLSHELRMTERDRRLVAHPAHEQRGRGHAQGCGSHRAQRRRAGPADRRDLRCLANRDRQASPLAGADTSGHRSARSTRRDPSGSPREGPSHRGAGRERAP